MINPILAERAFNYANKKHVIVATDRKLGSGQDGCVFKSSRHTAVKAFERIENFENELICYQRLEAEGIKKLGPFAVPELIGFSGVELVIEMSIVAPPFFLDFGKVWIDRKPDFSAEAIADKEAECADLYGERWGEVQFALAILKRLGIYYTDVRLGNITFGPDSASG
jgi:hypothetical protein